MPTTLKLPFQKLSGEAVTAPDIVIDRSWVILCGALVLIVATVPILVIESIDVVGLKLTAKDTCMPLPDWYLKYFLVWRTIWLSGFVLGISSTPPS